MWNEMGLHKLRQRSTDADQAVLHQQTSTQTGRGKRSVERNTAATIQTVEHWWESISSNPRPTSRDMGV